MKVWPTTTTQGDLTVTTQRISFDFFNGSLLYNSVELKNIAFKLENKMRDFSD